MTAPPAPAHARPRSPWAVALGGAVSLAIAMGIGRFAFTPMLPLMLQDGAIDLPGASWLASANYIGYLIGALLCMVQPWLWRRAAWPPPVNAPAVVRAGWVATALLTLAMALPWPALWPLLRLAAGVTSALVFVYTSGWCLAQLARRDAAALGGAIYTGPGAGIVVSGLCVGVLVQRAWSAAEAWLLLGALALVLGAAVWRMFDDDAATQPAATTARPVPGAPPSGHRAELAVLALAYGTAGLGYIVTATFLPVIARAALPASPWLDLFWPIFGVGVIVGALLSTRLRMEGDLRLLLAAAHTVQAIGIVMGIVWPTLAGFALSSLLIGTPFTAITFFAMQEVRRLRPAQAPSVMGLLTASYGIGQIAGPPLVALLLRASGSAGTGFTWALAIAAGTLMAGAALYLAMTRWWPRRP